MRRLRVVLIQMEGLGEDKEGNLAQAERLLSAAAAERPAIVCLPELFTTSYFCWRPPDAAVFSLAEPVPGPTTARIGRWCRDMNAHVICPVFEVDGQSYFNTAVLLDPRGEVVGRYRKVHVPTIAYGDYAALESAFFRPGDLGFPVFDIGAARIGILICWDRGFPEAWRCLRLNGAEVVFVPTAGAGWRGKFWLSELTVHAIENNVFCCAVNRAGKEAGGMFYGQSVVIDPLGETLAVAGENGAAVVTAELDLGLLAEAERRMPFLAGRRPDQYGVLVAPRPGAGESR